MTDKQISIYLNGSIKERNQALAELYQHSEYRPRLMAFLRSKGIRGADINELFNETLIKFSLIVKKGKYEEKGSMLGYLMNIAHYLVLDFHKQKPIIHEQEEIPEGVVFQGHFELKELFQELLSQLGDMCKQLLTFWAEGYKMKEIAIKMHIVSDTAVRKRKHSCLKKLLVIVNQDEEIKTVLQNYLHES